MVKRVIKNVFLVLLCCILIDCNVSSSDEDDANNSNGEGMDYYVSTTGNDSNNGSEGSPWRTIQKAANTAQAGDTVYIKGGIYTERVIAQHSGTSTSYITFSAYSGDTVTIDGTSVSVPSWGGLFDLSYQNYIKVFGLHVINSSSVSIFADQTHGVIVENNYTYNSVSSGIGIWNSFNATVKGNEVVLACNNGENECITVATTAGFLIKNNNVHDSGPGTFGGEGIDGKDGSSDGIISYNHVHHLNRLGIYVDSWDKHTYNIEVFNNIIHDIQNGADGIDIAAEAGGLLENVKVYNNLSYNNNGVGITIARWGEPVPNHPLKDIYIINNTFVNNGNASNWGGGIYIDNADIQNIVIRNNICSQNYSFQILREADVPSAQTTVEYNLIDGFRGEPGEIYGDNYQEGAPSFVSSTQSDFHIQANSLAIDNGVSTQAPVTDFDDQTRPFGQGWDIGADEYVVNNSPSLGSGLIGWILLFLMINIFLLSKGNMKIFKKMKSSSIE